MIEKRAYSQLVGDELALTPLDVRNMVKLASCPPALHRFLCTLRPDPKYTYVLAIAMGYSEYYGSNSNTDWYGYNPQLDINGLLYAGPEWGQDYEGDKIQAKTWTHGYPTYYNAAIYAHHKNFDPVKFGFGDVVFVYPNPDMKRIELVIRIHHDLIKQKGYGSFLDRLWAGEPISFSMGCRVPFDLCSICSDWDTIRRAMRMFDPVVHAHEGISILHYHKRVRPIRGLAITRADYCDHMLFHKGKILPNGQQVFVYNDFPRFFDFSIVWIPADSTAKSMWYLAPPVEKVANTKKIAILKRSAIKKEIPGLVLQQVKQDAESRPELPVELMRRHGHGVGDILSTLGAMGIVASPGEFQRLLVGDSGSRVFRPGAGLRRSIDVSPDRVRPELAEDLLRLTGSSSAYPSFILRRTEVVAVPKVAHTTDPLPEDSAGYVDLAAAYNGYRVSLLEQLPHLAQKVAHLLNSDLDLVSDLDRLLVSPEGMVHFLSAHLPTQKVAQQTLIMAAACTTPPSLSKLAHFGAELGGALESGATYAEAMNQLVDL